MPQCMRWRRLLPRLRSELEASPVLFSRHARARRVLADLHSSLDLELGTPEDDVLVDEVESTVCSVLSNELGAWDGHEFGAGWATIFLYGRSADALFECVAPALLKREMRTGSVAVNQYRGRRTSEVIRLGSAVHNQGRDIVTSVPATS